MNEWPDEESFKLNKWERKDNFIRPNEKDLTDSFQEGRAKRRRNIPRSSRRKF